MLHSKGPFVASVWVSLFAASACGAGANHSASCSAGAGAWADYAAPAHTA
jgi:hypothetical protein